MKSVEVYRALKKVLKMTYNIVLIDFILEPGRVEWRYAGQFKDDPKREWHPRIVSYYPNAKQIAIRSRINDPVPLYTKVETLMEMAKHDDPRDFRKDEA